jgi:type I site-specific restriction endonuclease
MPTNYPNERVPSPERTGWRCEGISKKHREWGFHCPAVDLDFVLLEYNWGKPVAIVEYKEKASKKPDTQHPSYRALKDLADGYRNRGLPLFLVRYCERVWWFEVTSLNESAFQYYSEGESHRVSQREFVRSLMKMRKDKITAEDERFLATLSDTRTEVAHE